MRYLMLAVFLFAPSAYAAPLQEAPEGNYDLVAIEVVHIPEEVVVGDEVVFVNHLTNQGTDAIPPRTYWVDFYVDGECVSFDHGTGGLRPGGTSTYSKAEGYYHFKPIISQSQLNFLLRRMKPGTEVSFGLVRNGVQMEKTVHLGTQPERRRPDPK